MATINVKNASGGTEAVGKYLPGRAPAADSAPVVLADEDKAALDAMTPGTATLVDVTVTASFAALSSVACKAVMIVNNRSTAVDLEWRMGGSGGTEIIPAGAFALIPGLTNSDQVQIKRATAGADVTVSTRRIV